MIFQSLPVEPFAESGIEVKGTELSGSKVVFSGYSNGSLGYLPTIEAYEKGGYETGNTPFAAGGAEEVVSICIEELKNITGNS